MSGNPILKDDFAFSAGLPLPSAGGEPDQPDQPDPAPIQPSEPGEPTLPDEAPPQPVAELPR